MARNTLRKSVQSILREFRLEIGAAVLMPARNTLYIPASGVDSQELGELLDELAVRALVTWYVQQLEEPAKVRLGLPLLEHLQSHGDYPFASATTVSVDLQKSAALTRLSQFAHPNLFGSIYESICEFPSSIVRGEHHIDRSGGNENRKRGGQFYTPADIVELCIDDGYADKRAWLVDALRIACRDAFEVSRLSDLSSLPKILDPSCGTGNFLVGMVTWLPELSSREVQTLVSGCLFGMELDGRAASIARLSVALSFLKTSDGQAISEKDLIQVFQSLRKNISVCDTTFGAPWLAPADGEQPQFDLVITNPPYVSYGARDQLPLLTSQKVLLKNKFPDSSEYKIRLHSIFQEISLRFAEPGARVVLLVPDSFLTGVYYQKLRELILKEARVVSITELPETTFSDAVVGRWSIATYEKGESPIASDVRVREISPSSTNTEFTLPAEVFVSPFKSRFRLISNQNDRKICELTDRLTPISTVLRGHTGIRALNGQSSVVAGQPQASGYWQKGIRSGRALRPFSVIWDNTWINVDPELLFKGGFDSSVIANRKILIRQTGDKIVAAVDESGLYHLNNVHSFSPMRKDRNRTQAQVQQKADPINLDFLTGLLNSSAMCHLYRIRTREVGRALAQIDIETIEDLPLPPADDALEQQVANLVQLMRTLLLAGDSREELNELKRRMDRLICQAFSFDGDLIAHIEKTQNEGFS